MTSHLGVIQYCMCIKTNNHWWFTQCWVPLPTQLHLLIFHFLNLKIIWIHLCLIIIWTLNTLTIFLHSQHAQEYKKTFSMLHVHGLVILKKQWEHVTGLDKLFERKIVNIFLPSFNICFECSKDSFEYPQHMFWLRNKKINFLVHTLN